MNEANIAPTLEAFIERLRNGVIDLEGLADRLEAMHDRINGPTPQTSGASEEDSEPSSHNARMERGFDRLQSEINRINHAIGHLEEACVMGLLKRIHVNQHNIRANAKDGGSRPPVTVKTSRKNYKCHNTEIYGGSIVRYSPNKPLSCGARMWIETRAAVALADEHGNAFYHLE